MRGRACFWPLFQQEPLFQMHNLFSLHLPTVRPLHQVGSPSLPFFLINPGFAFSEREIHSVVSSRPAVSPHQQIGQDTFHICLLSSQAAGLPDYPLEKSFRSSRSYAQGSFGSLDSLHQDLADKILQVKLPPRPG